MWCLQVCVSSRVEVKPQEKRLVRRVDTFLCSELQTRSFAAFLSLSFRGQNFRDEDKVHL